MLHTVTLIPGDGIGPEVAEAAVRVIEAAGVPIRWERAIAGAEALERHPTPLPPETLASIRRNLVALKGPVTTPVGEGFASVNVALRKELDLYASLRPVRAFPGVAGRYPGVDLVIVRENTEGLYSGREHSVAPGVVETLRIITRRASERIARFAFDYARAQGRRKITLLHKASVMRMSDGLFLESCRRVARQFPFIECDEMLVDTAAMELVVDPSRFDVLLMENLFGDLVSDLCAGMVGGLGLVPGANIGDQCAVFEAVHGSAPDIAGRGVANPTALILSAALLARHMGEREAAARITSAVEQVLSERTDVTPDLGGSASTTSMTDAIVRRLATPPATRRETASGALPRPREAGA
ncbi:MAG TPA: isocitrate/isopropylmalate dehydrogenase family protein [Candidatus Polarisedimenticolia bacterium]|nr:isocitrate/isopropylmalate dehydrogenase family protein [Candidatus Polarisedimenticolia bacterium]